MHDMQLEDGAVSRGLCTPEAVTQMACAGGPGLKEPRGKRGNQMYPEEVKRNVVSPTK